MLRTLDDKRKCALNNADVRLIERSTMKLDAISEEKSVGWREILSFIREGYPEHKLSRLGDNSFGIQVKALSACVSSETTNMDVARTSDGHLKKTSTGSGLFFYNPDKAMPTKESIGSVYRTFSKVSNKSENTHEVVETEEESNGHEFTCNLVGGPAYERGRQLILQGINMLPEVPDHFKLELIRDFHIKYLNSKLDSSYKTATQEIC
jgi:hypothetical protein